MTNLKVIKVMLLLGVLCPGIALAQSFKLNSTREVRPRLSVGSIAVSVSPSVVNMALVAGGQSAPSPTISINNLVSLTALGTFALYASFASGSALTDSAGNVIPASAVFGKCTTFNSYTPFTQLGPLSTRSSLLIYQTNSLATLLVNQNQTCNLMIDLTSLPQLPAGSYSGTLIVQAQAF